MKTIFKYPIEIINYGIIGLPVGAEILTVQEQFDKIVLYALIDPNQEKFEARRIEIFGTGHEVRDDVKREYLGTVKIGGGKLVFHLFERV